MLYYIILYIFSGANCLSTLCKYKTGKKIQISTQYLKNKNNFYIYIKLPCVKVSCHQWTKRF